MKLILLLSGIFILSTAEKCNKKSEVYKGKLEIKGLCMNYTIRLLDGDMDTSLYAKTWTDEHSGKKYENVFALGSRCDFPADIKEGDEFYFVVDSSAKQDCAVCMAYYPKPEKHVSIKVVADPAAAENKN